MPKPRKSYRKEVRDIICKGIEGLKNKAAYSRLVDRVFEEVAGLYIGRSEEAIRLIIYTELQEMVAGGGATMKRLKAGPTYSLTGKKVEVAERSFGNIDYGRRRKGVRMAAKKCKLKKH